MKKYGYVHQLLTESDFPFNVILSRLRLWLHFMQKRLSTGECTGSVCLAHMQQRPPVPDLP